MENKSHAFVAGLFTLALGLAALAALYWFGGKREETRDYVVVARQNVTGLNPQAQVRYRGIKVGKVTGISLEKGTLAILITIQVNADLPITHGTEAKLGYQGITGIAHILLEDNGRNRTPLDEVEGRPARIVMKPSLFDDLTEAGPVMVAQAREVMKGLNALLNEQNRQRISATLANLESTTGQAKPALENLNATLVQVRQLLADENIRKFSAAAGEAGPLLAETRRLVGRLASTADKLDAALGESTGSGGVALMPRLNEMASDISVTSRQLNRVLKMIEESPQSLVFGPPAQPPGPGEPGFVAPAVPGVGR